MRHSLRGTHCLGVDAISEFLPNHSRGGKIHSATKELLELTLGTSQAEVPNGPLEVRDQVDVTIRTRLIACN
jgi:hypothetical protein